MLYCTVVKLLSVRTPPAATLPEYSTQIRNFAGEGGCSRSVCTSGFPRLHRFTVHNFASRRQAATYGYQLTPMQLLKGCSRSPSMQSPAAQGPGFPVRNCFFERI